RADRVDQLLGAGEPGRAGGRGGAGERLRIAVRDPDQLEALDVPDRLEVDYGHVPAADQPDAPGGHVSSFLAVLGRRRWPPLYGQRTGGEAVAGQCAGHPTPAPP